MPVPGAQIDTRVYEPQIRARLGITGAHCLQRGHQPQTPKLPWREAGPLNHHDDKVDSDQ